MKKVLISLCLLLVLTFPIIEVSAQDYAVGVAKKSSSNTQTAVEEFCSGKSVDECPTDLCAVKNNKCVSTHVGADFCERDGIMKGFRIVGFVITVARVLVPLIIVGYGIYELYLAVLGGDQESLTKQARQFGIRIFIGILVFFIPSLIDGLLSGISSYSSSESDFKMCQTCVLNPNECTTTTTKKTTKKNKSNSATTSKTTVASDCSSKKSKSSCTGVKGCYWTRDNGIEKCVDKAGLTRINSICAGTYITMSSTGDCQALSNAYDCVWGYRHKDHLDEEIPAANLSSYSPGDIKYFCYNKNCKPTGC